MDDSKRRLLRAATCAALATLASARPTRAQGLPQGSGDAGDFPARPLRVIVPFAAGSGSDSGSRLFAEHMSKTLGQPIVVENRPGGNSFIAFSAVKAAPADGYTILLASNSPMTVNPLTLKNLPYDPVKDFRPISGIGRGMVGFFVSSNSPYKTLKEFVEGNRQKGHTVTVGTYSDGYRLSALWLSSITGMPITNVLYKGGAQIMTDVMAGAVELAVTDFGGAAPLLADGRVHALAVSGENRSERYPDVPCVKETYPEYVTYTWTSFYVLADTPDPIAAKLTDAMRKAHKTTAVRDYLANAATEAMDFTPEQMSAFQRSEYERFKRVADMAGIKPE